MTGAELKAYVVELLDGRTDLDSAVARALAATHREIQGNVLVPPGRPRRLDWVAQYKGAVAATYVPGTGVAVTGLVDEGGTFKRALRMGQQTSSGGIEVWPGVDDERLDGIRSGDVAAARPHWAYRNGHLVVEPDLTAGGTVLVDLLQLLPWVADDGSDWFTANLGEALAKGAAARVAGDLGEQVRPVRWREEFIALAIAGWHDGKALRDGAAADGVRPPVPRFTNTRGQQ